MSEPCPLAHRNCTGKGVVHEYPDTDTWIVACNTCGLSTGGCCDEESAIETWQSLPRTRWVSVDEREPEEEGRYLIYYTSSGGRRSAMFTAQRDYINGSWRWGNTVPYITITHWLDGIPDAP